MAEEHGCARHPHPVRLGLRPENLKAATAGKLQMWGLGWSAAIDDGDTFLALGSSKSAGKANKPRFNLPAFEQLYDKQRPCPTAPSAWP